MTRRCRSLVLACLGLGFCSPLAHAQDVADVLTRWGLLGTWSVDCASPPGRSNTYTTYVARFDRSAYYTREWGEARDTDPNDINAATILPDGMLLLREFMPAFNQTREMWLVKGADGRTRAMMNREVGGQYTVRDGRFAANGRETPWSSRCQ
jgi:hypothetical protein